MKRKILYKTNGYLFSTLEEVDLALIKSWRNQQMRILRQNKKLTSEDQNKWFKKVQKAKDQKIYSILNSKHELIGYCGLTNFDDHNKRAEVSFLASPKISENDYKELFEVTLDFLKNEAFHKYQLHKLYTETYSFRSAHIRVLEANGFIKTGVHSDHIYESDHYVDSYIHACLKQEKVVDSIRNKRVLVTGGAGVIGRELMSILTSKGAIVRCVDLVEKPKDFPHVEYWRLDLSEESSQFLIRFNPEYVFHLAADFERSSEDLSFWQSNFRNNILASHFVLDKVLTLPSFKKIVFASSYLIYDKQLYCNNSQINTLSETSEINPRNLTGIAKLQTERDIEFFSDNMPGSFSYANARIFRAYGRGSRDIISRWVRSALNGKTLKVFSENNSFDYIHARDVAHALLALALNNHARGEFNVASGKIF